MEYTKINKVRAILAVVSETVDHFRIVPRIIIMCYGYIMYQVTMWFMALPEPGTQQTAFISTLVGVAGVVIGLYQNSGTKWSEYTFRPWNDKIKPLIKKRKSEAEPIPPSKRSIPPSLQNMDEDEFY